MSGRKAGPPPSAGARGLADEVERDETRYQLAQQLVSVRAAVITARSFDDPCDLGRLVRRARWLSVAAQDLDRARELWGALENQVERGGS